MTNDMEAWLIDTDDGVIRKKSLAAIEGLSQYLRNKRDAHGRPPLAATRASLKGISISFLRLTRVWLAVICLAAGTPCMAQPEASISADVLRAPAHAVALVSDSQQNAYRGVISAYAQEEAAHPDDAALVRARCQFVEGFADGEELSWAGTVQADYQTCLKDLEVRFRSDAEASLYVAERRYGKEAIGFAETLLPASDHWTLQQRARLHAVLARAYVATRQPKFAGQEALAAVQLDPSSNQLVPALRYLCDTGQRSEAASLLAQTPVPAQFWMEGQRVRFASDCLSPNAALTELQRAETGKAMIDQWLAARIYLRAGMNARAADALDHVKIKPVNQTVDQFMLRVSVASVQRDGAAASAALRDWFGKAGISMPLLFAYGALLAHDPLQLFSPPLVPLALSALALLALMAYLPGLIAFPAHYRGIVRTRLHKLSPPLFPTIGLRHMWLGLGAFLVASTMVPMLGAESALLALVGSRPMSAGEENTVVVAQLAILIGGSVFLLPAAWRFSWREWIGDRGLKAALTTVVIWAVFKALVLWAISQTGHLGEAVRSSSHDRSVATLTVAAAHIGGAGLAMLIVAVLVPVYEELMFRCFVLGGLSRHLSFGWANMWQALLFAFLHYDAPHFLFYLVLGLLAGWLVRRTKGLAWSMALHALNNAIACAAILLTG